jgi:alginate O-acetyltransferase complex protein AlgI
MAIGIAKMIGFKFPENFNNPYISRSITEFWRRWHISLGAWMRNYLYIPLGGNRVSTKRRLYFNLWFVFLASGLWHGASWSFVIWGAYHGIFLVLERAFLNDVYNKMGKFASTIVTFFLVVIGWVFFRVENVSEAFLYLQRLFAFDFGNALAFDFEFYIFLVIAAFFAFFTYFQKGQKIHDVVFFNNNSFKLRLGFAFISISLLILSISSITAFGFNPFIYFRF